MNKTQKVMEHLQRKGSITSMEAFRQYNATRLSAIIFNLKKRGANIKTYTVETADEDGKRIFFAKYVLEGKANE